MALHYTLMKARVFYFLSEMLIIWWHHNVLVVQRQTFVNDIE